MITDEPIKHNPTWDEPMLHGLKLLGSASFFAPPQDKEQEKHRDMIGQHDLQVAWLAVARSNWAHRQCSKEMAEAYNCTASKSGDAHAGISTAHTQRPDEMRQAMCNKGAIRRPNGLAFNAHVFLVHAYEGKKGKNAYRKDDYYLDLHLPQGEKVPKSQFTERLLGALHWLDHNHARLNITVVAVGVLTSALFLRSPVDDAAITAAVSRLRKKQVVVLANGGNCRQWHSNCTGMTWPSIVDGLTPVAAASSRRSGGLYRSLAIEHDSSCSAPEKVPVVCGARYSSSALPYFGAAVLLLREAILRHRYAWHNSGDLQAVILDLVYQTGTPVRPNWKANICSNRRCMNLSRALETVMSGIG